MDWMQFATFMIGNMVFTLSLWLWNRSESRQDMRAIVTLISAINLEIKDFHGRLCALEEKLRK
jgi:hypothetical protein